ncbi:MAG TPA: hypothetical protein VF070_14270 [Streptosporangiaceae bacterium]
MAVVDFQPAGANGLRREALDWLSSEVGAYDMIPLHGGGSPALVWQARSAAGEPIVVKFLDAAAGLVDGHDLRTFLLKPRQIAHVHAHAPGLSSCYAQVIAEWHGPGMAAYVMPHYAGAPLGNALKPATANVPGFLATLSKILGKLTDEGYAAAEWPADASHFHLRYLDRIRRRLPLLRAHLDDRLIDGAGAWINGRWRPPLTRLLGRLASDHGLIARIAPTRLHFPVHGDLNLGNLLVRTGGFTALDPRGTLSPWDSVYDMAKIVFSLTVYEPAMAGGFVVGLSAAADGNPAYRLVLRHPRPASLIAASALPGMLGALPFFARLDRVDPGWRQRLAFAHALHCLAEAACRLSDRKPLRLPGGPRGWAACLELANGLLLTGLSLLDDLLADHLAGSLRLVPPVLTEIAGPSGVMPESSALESLA